ncbi:BTB/POZ-like [Macleaya cordata]|uniref:BTB/POZ-like n=1 Tax=Macleaya cordata TaxID=56857 RepID=A0A200QUQ3_MACCD|nr:BTB/POZ-like [Macleaya cordata]
MINKKINQKITTNNPKSPGTSDSDATTDHIFGRSLVVIDKFATTGESFEKKEKSWFPNSHIPTDLTIQVDDINFYLHKYTLISRSEYISQINLQPSDSKISYDMKLENFPGRSETFEMVLKFCYGLPVELTPTNVAPLRCASEFLQMTEEYEEGNLISKTEAFLAFVVLSSWRDTITVLKSCGSLCPWAENLQIVRRCCDSIARKVSTTGELINDEGWWFNDVSTLHIDHFVRIITGIRAKGLKPESIGACIMNYAEKWLPSIDVDYFEGEKRYGTGKTELQLSILSGKREGGIGENKEYRLMIESLVSILPAQRETVSCKFLLWMLKMAVVYSATQALVSELEKRIGMVLEDANVNDLLIPSFKNAADQGKYADSPTGDSTMHNIDMVQRIVEYFLMHEQQQQQEQLQQPTCGKLNVAKLLDGYLAEIARDPNLSIAKFQVLAEALTENARTCHDGLYRAIDTYLKTHPDLMEHDRRRLCKVMNCEKLSLDACMHAAQNERLPLRTVMQVLFSEQVKMRMAINEKDLIPSERFTEQESSLSSAKKEIKTIKAELDMVKMKMAELQHDYCNLQLEFEKLTKQKTVSTWSSGWKKIKNSTFFHTKMDHTETGEEIHHRPKRASSCDIGRRRRLSIS